MASQYLTAFNAAASPKPVAAAVPANENWDKFFA
jgi:hypothetical protein